MAQPARQLVDLAWATPMVVAQRLTRMALAGPLPHADQQREAVQMVSEKAAAAGEAWQSMARHAAGLWQPWASWMSHAWARPGSAAWWMAPATMWQEAWWSLWSAGVAPVRRRAVANARRLQRKPLR